MSDQNASSQLSRNGDEYQSPEEARADMADWLEKHADKCDRDGHKAIPIPANYRLAARLLREATARSTLSETKPTLPNGCYCEPGKCMAPKPAWCRDAQKRESQCDAYFKRQE